MAEEVAERSVQLAIGASVYLGEEAKWVNYRDLYYHVYYKNILPRIADSGYFVVIQTDQYKDGAVVPRNAMLLQLLLKDWGFVLLDEKVWKRKKGDFFQPPFSMVWVLKPVGGQAKRPKGPGYLDGVWDFPQTAGGKLNAYPDGLCRLLVESFTKPGDLILDPFAGTGRLIGIADSMDRRAVGFDIDRELVPTIKQNLGVVT